MNRSERIILVCFIGLLILAYGIYYGNADERVEKKTVRNELNMIYKYSISEDTEIIEDVEPEIADLTIMYFHQLLNEVDENTFFRLKEETVRVLAEGEIDVIPEAIPKEQLNDIASTKEARLIRIVSVDNLLVYEIEVENTRVRFKYLHDEERVFSEISEVGS